MKSNFVKSHYRYTHEFSVTSNACIVDDVAEAVERHHERRLVHVERVGDRGLGLLVRLGVDQSYFSDPFAIHRCLHVAICCPPLLTYLSPGLLTSIQRTEEGLI